MHQPPKVIVISHNPSDTSDISGFGVAAQDALAVHFVHVDGDFQHYVQAGFGDPALIVVYDSGLPLTLRTLQVLRRYHVDEPILVVTREQDEDCLVRVYAEGADECIDAGIGMDLLLAKLRVWLRWAATHGDSPLSPC